MRSFLVAFALIAGFLAGFVHAASIHGDWVPLRAEGRCIAWDPFTASEVGRWEPSADGRCHMRTFLWKSFWKLGMVP